MFKVIGKLPIFRTSRGRHYLSLKASKFFEQSGIKQFFGANLVAAVVLTGLVTPGADSVLEINNMVNSVNVTRIPVDPITLTTFDIPLVSFKISQTFSFWHPGLDLTTVMGSPIYALEQGTVESSANMIWGYGKHIIISHPHNIKTLYAHLSEINVTAGQQISRGQMIGKVGSTGWATGDHLHLEIHQNNSPLNPLEVLPLKPETIVFETTSTATVSASTIPTTTP